MGLMEGMLGQLLDAMTRYDLGHLQAHHGKFLERRKLDLTLPQAERLQRAMRAHARVKAVTPRVYASALLSRGTRSVGAQLVGLSAKTERQVTELHRKVTSGRFVGAAVAWPKARKLDANDTREDKRLTKQAEQDALAELDGLESIKGAEPKDGSSSSDHTRRRVVPTPAASSSRQRQKRRTRTLALARKLAPPPKAPPQVVLGAKLARLLRARVGQRVYVVSSTVDGAGAEVSVIVRGVITTGTDQFDRRVYFNLRDLQRLVQLDGKIHELAARVDRVEDARLIAASLRATPVDRAAIPSVESWDEMRPDIARLLHSSQTSMMIMVVVILFVAVLGVVNTMLMSVFERTREIGVLKAIGMSSFRLVRLILAETLLLTTVAGAIGTGLGALLDLYFVSVGIDLTGVMTTSYGGIGLDPVLRAQISSYGLLMPGVLLLGACFLAALYPASRAALMRPAAGMRDL
jgi:ABC-type lipoprotein release transport system permease subunit